MKLRQNKQLADFKCMKQIKFPLMLFALIMLSNCSVDEDRSLSSELAGEEFILEDETSTGLTGEEFVLEDDAVNITSPLRSKRPIVRPKALNIKRTLSRGTYKTPLVKIQKKFSPLCRGFITKDGSFGPWGQEMLKAMRSVERDKGKPIFFGKGASTIKFGARCKSDEYFQSLTLSQQEHIWMWLWASVAQAESSCRTWVKVKGIKNPKFKRYNIADGLFQLEHRTDTRRANGRSQKYCPSNTNTQAIKYQMECAASIIADTQSGKFLRDTTPRRWPNGTKRQGYTYWQKFRSPGKEKIKEIFELLKYHPLCE